jgi:geranylgeranyl diphosphate synthase, type I
MVMLKNNFLEDFKQEIDSIIKHQIDELVTQGPMVDHPFIHKVYEWANHYLDNHGRRMHGIAVILAYQAAEGKDLYRIIKIAAALQLYHHHTLVHDDIYDEDLMRRGWPTTHEAFANWFAKGDHHHNSPRRLFISDGKRFGTIAAFAYGKIIRALAFHLILTSGFSEKEVLKVVRLLNWHDIYDNTAQLKDIYCEKSNVSISECLTNAWLKTGKLFEVCAEIGSLLAKASQLQVDALKKLIGNIGLAYQLQDDLEDLSCDSEKGQGRGIGADLLCRKSTYLYALAQEMAQEEDRLVLTKWQKKSSDTFADSLEIKRVLEILKEIDIEKVCQHKIKELCSEGFSATLSAKPKIREELVENLKEFADYFLSREYWKRKIASGKLKAELLLDYEDES